MIKLTRRQAKAFTKYCFQDKLLAEGSGRLVYGFQNYVVKIAKNKNGRIQNKNEIERYNQYGCEKFAKIHAYTRKIIIMEKVKPLFEDNFNCTFNDLASWFEKTFNICSEDNMSQGETSDGRVVFYDYGYQNGLYKKYFAKDYCIKEQLMSRKDWNN